MADRPGGTVAIVGAGMAGASCARALADAGCPVRLFDKGRSAGGRMAQRRVPQGIFDHGAQYLAAGDPEFVALVERWRRAGVVAEWTGVTSGAGRPVVVGTPAMGAPVRALLQDLPVATGFRVTRLSRSGATWLVHGEDGALEGPFAAVVLAIPAPQAADLIAASGDNGAAALLLRLGAVGMAPCWSALAAFDERLPLDAPAIRGEGVLAWAARNASKPGRGDSESWTLHAAPDWSAAHLEDAPPTVASRLLAHFAELIGGPVGKPAWIAAHRWRYAFAERPLGDPCLWHAALRLGLCGDWCLGPRVEAAWRSGRALAAALAKDRGAL